MKTKSSKRKIIVAFISLLLMVSISFFSVDLIRAKKYSLPPMFCVKVYSCSDGYSTDYYGLGYKVWKDVHPFDNTVSYYVGLWILPKSINI